MKWLAVKKFLKKAWVWTKTHWWLPLLVLLGIVGLLLFALTRNSAFLSSVMDAYKNSRESYKKEVDALNEIHSREVEKRNQVLEEYNKNVKRLEEEHDNRDDELNSEKKKELKKLIEESYNDPERLAKELARLYGMENG